FALNEQTAVNNYFQPQAMSDAAYDIHAEALREFDAMMQQLREADIEVIVVQDTPEPHTPDSIFPNNWVSFHEEGHVLYPMYAVNRRMERDLDIWSSLLPSKLLLDLSDEENKGRFLEGTGSLVLDQAGRVAYAALSERTNEDLVIRWCEVMKYTPVMFSAMQTVGGERLPIYHTNVMMSVGEGFALWCPQCIDDS
ncbi:MAG: arginine deiminase-related protein, partial [Flavobacteriales bacterium]